MIVMHWFENYRHPYYSYVVIALDITIDIIKADTVR